MTAEDFAAIVDAAYVDMRPWSAKTITETLAQPQTCFLHRDTGGLIARIVADECEILALATAPEAQRSGVASSLLADLRDLVAKNGVTRIFLEVAEGNASARAFYAAKGFVPIGTRKGYYRLRDGSKDDAVLLSLTVP
ncbi:GNAT family N-acetyltransferase [Marivita hallyeonensis]|uniref:Ribosomal-protein-alanine N-acetyltransferase n=1 Tax=Marivita hallyeonensis TaxID=996342 RepID=A0A1M5M083_9RHOB|nr:GNAT family N-acetyltransferase [Marivita hallyeonensis]SHG70580.1 ribosomal-protein-alanine N-acetyltransferase [Marivita hallyeonensis]